MEFIPLQPSAEKTAIDDDFLRKQKESDTTKSQSGVWRIGSGLPTKRRLLSSFRLLKRGGDVDDSRRDVRFERRGEREPFEVLHGKVGGPCRHEKRSLKKVEV